MQRASQRSSLTILFIRSRSSASQFLVPKNSSTINEILQNFVDTIFNIR